MRHKLIALFGNIYQMLYSIPWVPEVFLAVSSLLYYTAPIMSLIFSPLIGKSAIPEYIKRAETVETFKTRLKTFLFKKHYC